MKNLRLLLLLLLAPALVFAQPIPGNVSQIKSGAGADKWTINTSKEGLVKDTGAEASLTAINGKLPSTVSSEATLALLNAKFVDASKVLYRNQTTTVQTTKGTAGTLLGYYYYNPNATAVFVQVFDVASATTVTLGTTVPSQSFGIPPGAAANIPVGPVGVGFTLGIKLAVTTTEDGSTAPASGVTLNVWYK